MAQAGNLADGNDIVCEIEKRVATEFINTFHYTQKHRESSILNYGCYHDGQLVTVLTYGQPSCMYVDSAIHKNCYFNEDPPVKLRWLELTRMAKIAESEYPLSKIVSLTLKDLTRRSNSNDGYYAVISYADAGVGHEGYIYQASNFIYCGRGDDRIMWAVSGKDVHYRSVRAPNEAYSEKKPYVGDIQVTVHGKHRYFYFCVKKQKLRDKIIQCLRFKPEPYPKGQEKNYIISDGKVEWQEVHK